MSKEALIAKYRKIHKSSFSDAEWECDIFSIFADLIKEYVDAANYDPGPSFTHNVRKKQKLNNLLLDDLEDLSRWYEPINKIKTNIHFEELYDGFPAASNIVYSNLGDKLILVSTPLLNTIHNFFSYSYILSQESKTENCLPKYDELAMSNLFEDSTIVTKIAHEMKVRFIDNNIEHKSELDFVYSPFDVCERVRAARQFIIAHELSHILLNHAERNFSEISSSDKSLTFPLFNKIQEYEADLLASEIVLAKFLSPDGQIKNLTDNEKYEFINIIIGIRMYFFMMEFVECFREWYKIRPETPRPQIRDVYCTNKFIRLLTSNERYDLLDLLEGFSVAKGQLLQIFRTAPSLKYGIGMNLILNDAKFKSDEEILYENRGDLQRASFIIMNRDYGTFRDNFEIYNSGLFDDISAGEFGQWLYYYYIQFGPKVACEKCRQQLQYKKLQQEGKRSATIISEMASNIELMAWLQKRADKATFFEELRNENFDALFKYTYSSLIKQ